MSVNVFGVPNMNTVFVCATRYMAHNILGWYASSPSQQEMVATTIICGTPVHRVPSLGYISLCARLFYLWCQQRNLRKVAKATWDKKVASSSHTTLFEILQQKKGLLVLNRMI